MELRPSKTLGIPYESEPGYLGESGILELSFYEDLMTWWVANRMPADIGAIHVALDRIIGHFHDAMMMDFVIDAGALGDTLRLAFSPQSHSYPLGLHSAGFSRLASGQLLHDCIAFTGFDEVMFDTAVSSSIDAILAGVPSDDIDFLSLDFTAPDCPAAQNAWQFLRPVDVKSIKGALWHIEEKVSRFRRIYDPDRPDLMSRGMKAAFSYANYDYSNLLKRSAQILPRVISTWIAGELILIAAANLSAYEADSHSLSPAKQGGTHELRN